LFTYQDAPKARQLEFAIGSFSERLDMRIEIRGIEKEATSTNPEVEHDQVPTVENRVTTAHHLDAIPVVE
jgi:hypothetical protein